MTRSFRVLLIIVALGVFSRALAETTGDPAAGGAQAGPAAEAMAFPAQFYATIVVTSGPSASGTSRMKLILQRWSTVEERQAMMRALKEGGQDALIAQMEKAEVGRVSIDDALGWPVRLAGMRKTETGTKIRIATDRPMAWAEFQRMSNSSDYPIGFMEFTMPADGKLGEGSLIIATRVKVDDDGDIVVESMPGNTSPQRLQNVRQEKASKKKK